MLMGTVAMVGVVSVAAMNMIGGPITTAAKVTNQNMAQNDLLMNAKVVVMNASTRLNMGDEDSDGYIEPVAFVPTSVASCNLTLPAEGGCLPGDIGAILTDPWGTQYAYCVWDHGDVTGSANRIAGEDSTSGAVLAIMSAGPNKRFETPCLPYDGDPATNDIAINPDGLGDDLVEIFTYAGAVAGSGGLWELKKGEPETAVIDKRLEVGDVAGGTGFAFDTTTGEGEFPYIKTDFIASKSGGNTPVTMDSNIALDGRWLSGGGGNEGVYVDSAGNIGIGLSDPKAILDIARRYSANLVKLRGAVGHYNINVQDGSGRINHYWNTTGGQTPTFEMGGEPALNFKMHPFNSYGYQFNYADGRAAQAGDPIVWKNLMSISTDGKVGIGSQAPEHDLSVVKNDDHDTTISISNNHASGQAARSVLYLRGNGNTSNSGGLMYANTSFTLGTNYEALRPHGLSLYTNGQATGGISIASGSSTGVFTINVGGLGQATERLRITANGNVGIGITNPQASLDVAGTVRITPTETWSDVNWRRALDLGQGEGIIWRRGSEGGVARLIGSSQLGDLYIGRANGNGSQTITYDMLVRTDGKVGIGTTSPSHILHVNGIARSTQASFATSSDKRVKQDIVPLSEGIDTIMRLRPVSYRYKSEYAEGKQGMDGLKRGFVAQEVEAVVPAMVTQTTEEIGEGRTIEDFRILNNGDFTPILVKAVQELKQENDALRDELKAANDNFRRELDELKSAIGE